MNDNRIADSKWISPHFLMMFQSLVSVKRINKFMNAEELDEESVSHDENPSKICLLI